MRFIKITIIFYLLITTVCGRAESTDYSFILKNLRVPYGFKITIFADNVPNARSLALGDNGVVYVGTTYEGKVYAIQDADNDGKAEKNYTIATGLNFPNGVAYKDGALYVGEISRITRYDGITQQLANPPPPEVVYNNFPTEQHHGWKYLRFGPDDKLYTVVGSPCNMPNDTCKLNKPMHATLVRLNKDGTNAEILARGIRNSVGIDWDPQNNDLYFTDNGRDWLGDDTPAEELNRWSGTTGEHFGYPYCHAGKILDPEFGVGRGCDEFTKPVWRFRPHNAPLGFRFYRGNQFPDEYKNKVLAAMHGSWNRSVKDGYRIAMVNNNNGAFSYGGDFIGGWLTRDGTVLGRPVDILETPDGSILISDDKVGVIYRVTYQGK